MSLAAFCNAKCYHGMYIPHQLFDMMKIQKRANYEFWSSSCKKILKFCNVNCHLADPWFHFQSLTTEFHRSDLLHNSNRL